MPYKSGLAKFAGAEVEADYAPVAWGVDLYLTSGNRAEA